VAVVALVAEFAVRAFVANEDDVAVVAPVAEFAVRAFVANEDDVAVVAPVAEFAVKAFVANEDDVDELEVREVVANVPDTAYDDEITPVICVPSPLNVDAVIDDVAEIGRRIVMNPPTGLEISNGVSMIEPVLSRAIICNSLVSFDPDVLLITQ
jgi:hypothetical protein